MGVELTAGIVRILRPDGITVGTGFLVSDKEGLIATCAHVVEACGAGPGSSVHVAFHATGEERESQVELAWWRAPDAEDVAILRLDGPLPEGVIPLPLGSSAGVEEHTLTTFGFPAAKPVEGMAGKCEVVGCTTERGFPVLQLRSSEVTPGYSGAPMLDTVTRRVVGMVIAITVPDRYGRLVETSFITPTETLWAVCPELQLSDLCPYRSLAAFTEADAEFFFGRGRVVEQLLEGLRREPRFLAVLGPSGSGKSSLLQAGLIPQLRRGAVLGSDRWGVIVTRPADQPFAQLEAQGLPGALEGLIGAVQTWLGRHPERERLVLIVDQFEELLVTCPEALRQTFTMQLTGLLETSLPVTVVLMMRDDFYNRFAWEVPDLLPWLERGLVNVPPTLTRDELQAIVEEPAQAVGLTFEAGLVETILEDALESAPEEEGRVGRSTVLPLLEFALTQLWERRGDGMLTHEVYGAIGGVTGGLTQWADRAYYGLEEEQRGLARRILTDLVHLGDESQGLPDSRRRRPLDALSREKKEQETVHGVVRLLADARLLVTGRDLRSGQETVDLIHDALLREWGLLRRWIVENWEFLLWRQRLNERLAEWDKGHGKGVLLRDELLAEAQRWLWERRDDLNQTEQAFIKASQKRQAEEERRWQELQAEVIAVKQLATLGIVMAALQHRINNTFNIIVPNVTRLRKRVDMTDETTVEILDIIERNVRYTSDIIKRVQEPLRASETQEVNVNAVLDEVMSRWRELRIAGSTQALILITVDLDESIPHIQVSGAQIAEVFRNLVDNACRVMKKGGQLTITSQLDDGKICVRVQDTGTGIPPEIRQRLFVKPVPSREPGGGAGLGLWLSRLMLQSIGGDVIIEETSSIGTTMLVQIPAPSVGSGG